MILRAFGGLYHIKLLRNNLDFEPKIDLLKGAAGSYWQVLGTT
jgi:hypothetical protein